MRYSPSKYSVTLKTGFGVLGLFKVIETVIYDLLLVELFYVKYYRDIDKIFEIWVTDHSRSLKMVPFLKDWVWFPIGLP